MKINGKKPSVGTSSGVQQAGGGVNGKKGAPGKPSEGDRIDISSKARELNRVKKMLESVPEVRSDMVVRLKTDVERGNYHVDAGKVAEKMIERALKNALYSKKV